MADQWIVEFANRIAQHQPGRLLALLAATWLPAVPFLLLLWLAVAAIRRRQAPTVSLLALAAVGALASFGLHQLVDHLYFRPRPYWALPAVHAIGARRGDSSFFSLEAAIAAALACGLLLAARRWGLVAVAAALLVGLGQLATDANYPFDVLVGLAVGAACTAALLPLRHRLQRLAGRLLRTPVAARGPRRRELRLGVIALVLLVGLGGWLVARVQDHGLRIAFNRADARLGGRLPTDARLYRPTTIDTLAAGRWRPTRARVYGGRSPTSTASSTATSTSCSRPLTVRSWSWRSSQSCPSARPTTTTASPPGGSSATTGCTTGGSSTRSSAGPTAGSPPPAPAGSTISAILQHPSLAPDANSDRTPILLLASQGATRVERLG
jgi:membrane-associated phospholipid phosphatase